ncbi:MAG: hypothetical protein ACNA8W_02370 [Bradymonadaceae bacterium]
MIDLLLIDGDLPIRPTIYRGPEIIAQYIRRRLLTFEGEWILDRRVGLPWLRWKEKKPVPLDVMRQTVRETIRTTTGVLDVRELVAGFDAMTRTVTMSGVIAIEGDAELLFDALFPAAGNVSPTISFTSGSGAIIL